MSNNVDHTFNSTMCLLLSLLTGKGGIAFGRFWTHFGFRSSGLILV